MAFTKSMVFYFRLNARVNHVPVTYITRHEENFISNVQPRCLAFIAGRVALGPSFAIFTHVVLLHSVDSVQGIFRFSPSTPLSFSNSPVSITRHLALYRAQRQSSSDGDSSISMGLYFYML